MPGRSAIVNLGNSSRVGIVHQQDVPTEVLFEVRALAGSMRRYFLGHELKSFEVFASVAGSAT